MIKVFTDEYVQSIKKRYDNKPEHERPYMYSVAVSDEGQYLRSEVEEIVAALSPAEQRVVIPRLTAEDNFLSTRHELAIGYLLRELGYQVEYDKEINGLTPDWYVYPKDKKPEFIVEVFTTTSGREQRIKEEFQHKDLEARLAKISRNITSKISGDITLEIFLDDIISDLRFNKRIVEEIKCWLENNPFLGAEYEGNGFNCSVYSIVNRDTGILNIKTIISPKFLLVEPNILRNSIKKKVEKYRKLEMPVVVAVVSDLEEELKSILVGGIQKEIYYDKSTGVKYEKISLLNDGLFKKKPELSAVVWINKQQSSLCSEWKISAMYNPYTTRPLPYNTFGEKECQIKF